MSNSRWEILFERRTFKSNPTNERKMTNLERSTSIRTVIESTSRTDISSRRTEGESRPSPLNQIYWTNWTFYSRAFGRQSLTTLIAGHTVMYHALQRRQPLATFCRCYFPRGSLGQTIVQKQTRTKYKDGSRRSNVSRCRCSHFARCLLLGIELSLSIDHLLRLHLSKIHRNTLIVVDISWCATCCTIDLDGQRRTKESAETGILVAAYLIVE